MAAAQMGQRLRAEATRLGSGSLTSHALHSSTSASRCPLLLLLLLQLLLLTAVLSALVGSLCCF